MEARNLTETLGGRAGLMVLVAGIAATLALQMAVPSVEVFWSGDSGLKNLQAKQFARGDMNVDLHLTEKEWVRALWDDGLHPGDDGNYIYKIDGRYFPVFPYPYPLLNAPFYHLLGVRGYYVIPVVAMWIMWITIYVALRRTRIEPWMIALLMASLIFAMPITLYAATFWEHALGLALALVGVVYTLRDDGGEGGRSRPLLAGGALGLAVWFRPEMMALIAILLPAAFVWRRRVLGVQGWLLFSLATANVIVLFLLVNLWIYGHPLGTHSIQMRTEEISATRLQAIVDRFVDLARMTVRFAPIGALLAAMAVVLVVTRRFVLRSEYVYLSVVAIGFFPLMVYMVPGHGGFQPGPRFALIGFLLMILIAAHAWRAMPQGTALRSALVVLLLATMLVGAKRSALDETRRVVEQYSERVLPAFTFLSRRDEQIVAIARTEILLELGGLAERKDFFAAFDDEKFSRLLAGLRAQEIDRFIFVAFGDLTGEHDSVLRHEVADGLQIDPLGDCRYGAHFYFYAVTIPKGPPRAHVPGSPRPTA